VRARGVERLGGTAGGDVQSSSGVVISSSSVAQHSGMRRRRGGANDDIVGKMVKITKGNMKGYLGRVVSANSTKARVKFQSKPRPLAFALSHIQRVDDDELSQKIGSRRHAAAGGATPSSAYGAGSLTPMIGNMGSFTPGHEVGTPMGGSSTPYLSSTPGVGGTPRSAAYAAADGSEAWDPSVTGTPLLAAQEAERLSAMRAETLSAAGGSASSGHGSAYTGAYTGASSAYSVSGVDSQSESGGGRTPAYSQNGSYGSYISSTSEWESSQGGGGSSVAPSGAASVAGSASSRWGQAAPAPPAPLAADASGPSYNAAYNWIQRGLVLHGTSSEGVDVVGSVIGRENNICRVRPLPRLAPFRGLSRRAPRSLCVLRSAFFGLTRPPPPLSLLAPQLKLRGDAGGMATVTDWQTLRPVVPKKKDKVKIVSGEFKGLIGELINIDNADGIVQMVDLDIKIIEMKDLASMDKA
jgi:ribosomal protein L24